MMEFRYFGTVNQLMKSVSLILLTGFYAVSCKAQVPLNVSLGIYARSEQNIYRYYNGLGEGNFFTQRVSNGYSAGAMLHSSINYLFNAGASLGISETSYSPNINFSDNTLWKVQLRLWQINFWGELKLGTDEEKGVRLTAGGEWMIPDYRREIWSNGINSTSEERAWPQTRFMPRIGLSYELPYKKWVFMPNTGLRLAFNNRMGYDYVLNQFYAGLSVGYKIYNW